MQLRVANALWGQENYRFKQQYLDLTRRHYGAGLQQVDFQKNLETARRKINGWVEEKTEKKIKELIPKGALNKLTRLVLTNAVYFKARWANVFEEGATRDKEFVLLDGSKIEVPTMHGTHRFGYRETEGAKILEMPYKGHRVGMVVILPDKSAGLPELTDRLSVDRLRTLTEDLDYTRVSVALPRFKMSAKFRLEKVLAQMGMPDAFDPDEADFSGITEREKLHIQAALHKAYVDVYEKGTEAAAATGIAFGAESVNTEPPKEFRADHPFLFLIRERERGTILFLGRVVNPGR